MEHKKIDREPRKGGLVISKTDAAERQLRTAIWLWFHDFDPVPIHGLASAALKVLWKLHEKHKTGHKTIRDEIIDRVKSEYQRDFIEMLNETGYPLFTGALGCGWQKRFDRLRLAAVPQPLVAPEEEQLVLNDAAAACCPELILL